MTRRHLWARLAAGIALASTLALAALAYGQPGVMVQLAELVWGCFG